MWCFLLSVLFNLASLHQQGYTGQGITIAVLDGGFYNADRMWPDRIVEVHDLLPADTIAKYGDIFANPQDYHGTACVSTILGDSARTGTAPEATVILIRTEETAYETLDEVTRLAQGFHLADSLGADVITCSLGYSDYFTDPADNYTYDDIDGTSPCALAASEVGLRRIVCCSAGNDGNKPFHYIGTPADARNILTIGACDTLGVAANFSSFGPTADGRPKPEVAALGKLTWVNTGSGWYRSNGTSFSTPEVAGLMACLRQAFPTASSAELREAVIATASLTQTPDCQLGHGIPDAPAAFAYLQATALPNYHQNVSSAQVRLQQGRVVITRGNTTYTLLGGRIR